MDDRHADRLGVFLLRATWAPTNCPPDPDRSVERAQGEGKRLGRPPSLDEDQMTAIRQDLAENMTVGVISCKHCIPGRTLRDNIESAGILVHKTDMLG